MLLPFEENPTPIPENFRYSGLERPTALTERQNLIEALPDSIKGQIPLKCRQCPPLLAKLAEKQDQIDILNEGLASRLHIFTRRRQLVEKGRALASLQLVIFDRDIEMSKLCSGFQTLAIDEALSETFCGEEIWWAKAMTQET